MSTSSAQVGTVISTFEGPSTRGFAFVVTNPLVRKGQYVIVEGGEEGGLVAVVKELLRANRYFERAESVSEYEKRPAGGQSFLDSFPVNSWEYIVAQCSTLGSLQKTGKALLSRAAFPPAPGSKVSLIDEGVLSEFLGFVPEGLHLGRLIQHEVPAKISLSRMLQKHLAILGISGSGKSHFTSVLLEELLERKPAHGRTAVVVFDVHGEYVGFADKHRNPGFADKVFIVKGKEVRIAFHKLGLEAITDLVPEMSSAQARDLEKILKALRRQMKAEHKAYDLLDAMRAVETSGLKDNIKGPLLGCLGKLRRLHLFARADNPSVRELVKPGKMLVFDLSSLTSQQQKRTILAYFTRKLFKGRREGVIPPFVTFVEEAHNFCLSADTEILTPAGWKKYMELKEGDLAFSYDKDANKAEPNPIERLVVLDFHGDMIKLENQDSIDCLATPDHRVLCQTRTTGSDRKMVWSQPRFVPAGKLPSNFKIPVTAQFAPVTECAIDDEMIRTLGWIITDGHLHSFHGGKYKYYEISQSDANSFLVQKMRNTVVERFNGATISSRMRPGHMLGGRMIHRSRENIFYLGAEATEEIKTWLGERPHGIPRKFLETASLRQLKVMFDALVEGDGTIGISKNGYQYVVFYPGYDDALADDFQELCTRLGYSAEKLRNSANNQITVNVSSKRRFASVRNVKNEFYSGKVWDITIKHGAFIARRNGKVFLTGNCPEKISKAGSQAKHVIETIAREGRKFGACLCLISQRPVQLSTTALSQSNTFAIFKITNPYDLKHIAESCEALDNDVMGEITLLKTGEGIVIGEAVEHPVFVKVRGRKSLKGGRAESLEQMAREFEELSAKEQSAEDIEQFI